jgi:DNA-3-methyladenine glycosylase I
MAIEKPNSYCEHVEHLDESSVHRVYPDSGYGFPIDSDDELFGRLVFEINQAVLSLTKSND